MSLRDDLTALLGRGENAGDPLAGYLTHCLNAFNPEAWRNAVAIRAEWDKRHPPVKGT